MAARVQLLDGSRGRSLPLMSGCWTGCDPCAPRPRRIVARLPRRSDTSSVATSISSERWCPELDRVAEPGADDLAWVAERNAESALDILERLRSSDALDSDAVRALANYLVALIDADDTIALPLLCRRLEDHDLDRLADAAHEVVANAAESTASSSFGSAPG